MGVSVIFQSTAKAIKLYKTSSYENKVRLTVYITLFTLFINACCPNKLIFVGWTHSWNKRVFSFPVFSADFCLLVLFCLPFHVVAVKTIATVICLAFHTVCRSWVFFTRKTKWLPGVDYSCFRWL